MYNVWVEPIERRDERKKGEGVMLPLLTTSRHAYIPEQSRKEGRRKERKKAKVSELERPRSC